MCIRDSDNSSKNGDYLAFALQSTLNQFSGERRITKLSSTHVDDFIINELVKAGSGVLIPTTTGVDSIVKSIGKGNVLTVKSGKDAQIEQGEFALNGSDLSVVIKEIVEYLHQQGFY